MPKSHLANWLWTTFCGDDIVTNKLAVHILYMLIYITHTLLEADLVECLKESQCRVTIVTEQVQQGSQLLQVDIVRWGPDRAVNFGENDRDSGFVVLNAGSNSSI